MDQSLEEATDLPNQESKQISAVNVELKAHVPPVESIRKDLEKLREAFPLVDAHLAERRGDLLVAIYTLGDAEPWTRMLRFTGEAAANREAVGRAFAEDPAPAGPARGSGSGKGAREGYFVFAPDLAGGQALHLSIRGGSYRLRRYFPEDPERPPQIFTLPGCRTEEEVRRSPRLTGWIPVSVEDRAHNIDEEPAYWSRRIREVSSPGA